MLAKTQRANRYQGWIETHPHLGKLVANIGSVPCGLEGWVGGPYHTRATSAQLTAAQRQLKAAQDAACWKRLPVISLAWIPSGAHQAVFCVCLCVYTEFLFA